MKNGHQDFWVAGTRVYFKRDPIASVEQPIVDMGVVKGAANPNISPTKLELKDADGGRLRLVEQAVIETAESYDVVLHNFSPENLAIAWLANPPQSFTQAAESLSVTHKVQKGRLLKIHDDDPDATWLYMLSSVGGVYSGVVENKVIESITVSTKIIKLTGDQTAEAGLAAGKKIIVAVTGLTNPLNSRSYTVVSAVLNATKTDVTVEEEPVANEAAITGVLIIENGGTISEQDVDWEVVSLDRGLIRIMDTPGALIDNTNYTVVFSTAAITGQRLIHPQDLQGTIEGKVMLVYGRGGNSDQTVREMMCSVTPNGFNISAEAFSELTLTFANLVDIDNATAPAGRLLGFKGDLPDKS